MCLDEQPWYITRYQPKMQPPIRLPHYRLAHHSKEFLRAEIQTLLKQAIIEPSTSPWAAPRVLVAKKDGSHCMCVDNRKLRAFTIGDPYPLPHIEELINGIGASKFITTLDLTKGYYQIPVAPKHKEKTVFINSYGKYQFTTVPFGLVSAPSTFQRLMDEVLHGLHEFLEAYLDDILIHSATWAEHVHHLTHVFDRLRSGGLRVKERKCSFAKNKCVYLGYVVGGSTIESMECKVLAVQRFAKPRTRKQVRSFLGLCGYYRKFRPEFSTVAGPLSDLTKKNMSKSVKWTSKCEKAFGQLKQALSKAPVLITPD